MAVVQSLARAPSNEVYPVPGYSMHSSATGRRKVAQIVMLMAAVVVVVAGMRGLYEPLGRQLAGWTDGGVVITRSLDMLILSSGGTKPGVQSLKQVLKLDDLLSNCQNHQVSGAADRKISVPGYAYAYQGRSIRQIRSQPAAALLCAQVSSHQHAFRIRNFRATLKMRGDSRKGTIL